MLKALRILTLLVCVFSFSQVARSAHLIGGEMSYTCLGANNYALQLRIFRDCAGGGAPFDGAARVAIYDTAGNLVQNLTILKGVEQSVNFNPTNDPCLIIPPGLCSEWTTYKDTVNLPPIPGGYNIVHQRCCRNAIIGNLVNPSDIGSSIATSIPSLDTTCNSSPRFDSIIPTILCVNEPFDLPIQVSEDDGDSLSFKLCQIFAGGGQIGGGGCGSVVPNPPCPPPFTPAVFQSSFSFSNPFPSSPSLSVNSQTGRFTGRATQPGTYVLGFCVEEWRNGQKLSTVRLDYQFTVANCPIAQSDMVTAQEEPEILCDGLTVNFKSEVKNTNSVRWDFGDPTTTADTSRQLNPQYTYPNLGVYTVTLIAEPGTQCSDTLQEDFFLKYLVQPRFISSGVFCFGGQDIDMAAQGIYPRNARFEWDFGGDADTTSATGRVAPKVEWNSPGYKPVTFTVFWDSCSRSTTDSVFISSLGLTTNVGPDLTLRPQQKFTLTASPPASNYYWYADRPVEMSNPFGRENEVIIRSDEDTVTFFLRQTDELGCEGLDSMQVFVLDAPFKSVMNVMTPNGDGKNDVLNLAELNPDGNCNLSVINRWGKEVYSKNNYQNDWSGIDKGLSPLPDGTYYFRLSCNGVMRFQGGITILRS